MLFSKKKKNKFYDSKATLEQQKDRLKEIVGNKWQGIFNGVGENYWKNIFVGQMVWLNITTF